MNLLAHGIGLQMEGISQKFSYFKISNLKFSKFINK